MNNKQLVLKQKPLWFYPLTVVLVLLAIKIVEWMGYTTWFALFAVIPLVILKHIIWESYLKRQLRQQNV